MIKSELEKDIKAALKILYQEQLTEEEEITYAKLYPWSNENIASYYQYYDLTNKKALCVTGSGDHLLYAAAAGATEIDAFDKNRLCKYYSALKIALILSYTEEDFYKQFIYKRTCVLSKKLDLKHLDSFLPEDYSIFWQELSKTRAFKKNIILFRFDGSPSKFNLNYNYLKEILPKVKINYHDMNANEFLTYNQSKYDAIFLSNILEWSFESDNIILNKFYNLLNDNGIIYDYFLKRKNSSSSYTLRPETQIITSPGLPGIEELTNEKVLIYRKTKNN